MIKKQIINGKLYNTDTATEIDSYWNNLPPNDFGYYQETLYQTKKGAYFLAGEGGGLSKYSELVGNNARGYGTRITVLREDEALHWCETHEVEPELIAEHFQVEEA